MKRCTSRNMGIAVVLSIIAVITICLSMSSAAFAKNTKINLDGKQYELEAKSKYAFTDGITPTSIGSTGSQFGLFSISGNLEEKASINGFPAYEVTSGKATFSYSPSGRVIGASETDWHLIEDKDSEVNGEKLDKKILNGVVILQSSIDGQRWITDSISNNIAGEGTDYKADFYEASEIQLINGCFYRVIVAYEVERKLDDKQILFVKVGNSEQKKYVETYEFYLQDTSEATIASGAHPNTKKIIGDMTKVTNTGKDNGFSGQNAITGKDPHYGWKIGEFSLRGYTNTADYQGEEYFLKNLGDSVTLSFTLLQNIDCLNNKQNLSISEDKNGSDQFFQVAKTNFKHGTLIIRFTDFEGNKSDPIIYTDFLAANARTGADTRVQLFEEGDYEVALDYEIKDSSGVDSYTNYRMSFGFKIRNGNNMAYAFDSSGQLADKAWTLNGFTINTANSHYLTVKVDKFAVVDGVNGKKLDQSWSRTASDGSVYKDPGVYTVTVSNRYQPDGDISKTFYVGNDPYIRAIPITGKDLNEIVSLISYTDYDMETYLTAMNKEHKSLDDIVKKVKEGWTIDDFGKLIEPIQQEQETEAVEEPSTEVSEKPTAEKEVVETNTNAEPVSTTNEQTEETDPIVDKQTESTEEKIVEDDSKEKTSSAPIVVLLAVLASAGGVLFARNQNKKKKKDNTEV